MDQSYRTRAPVGAPLSLEASLEEENKEVLAQIEKHRTSSPRVRPARGVTPPPVRSMLDVDSPPQRHGSIAGIGVGITSPRDQRRPSRRLDPADPSTWTKPHQPSSPVSSRASVDIPQQGLPKIQLDDQGFEHQYNFDMSSMPTSTGGAIREKRQNSIHSATTVGSEGLPPTTITLPPETTVPVSIYTKATKPLSLTPDSPRQTTLMPAGNSPTSRRRSSNKSSFSDYSEEPTGRVQMDEDGDEDAVAESSEDEAQSSTSEDESPVDTRGRTREKPPAVGKDEVDQKIDQEQNEDRLAPQSRGVRSLLDPVTSPSRPHDRKPEVHPPSSFGRSGPKAEDFMDDDMEADIQRAKNLGVNISPVDDSIADRHVRMIIRGDWRNIQEEAEENNHPPKLYLACTDLSNEATYALEWTVGTILRDGDTLLAIYAIEDELAPKEAEGNAIIMAESAKAAHDASNTMAKLTRQVTDLGNTQTTRMSKFIPVTEAPQLANSADARNATKKEFERLKAMDEITDNFLKLVRKTPLQIRCMIEVIHVKSPKHLILNAIDELDPTLCIVGTRGRSSLKGVLLGSFSNYLVTKSSVPVMVARKRLKKPRHAKVNSINSTKTRSGERKDRLAE